MIAQNYAGCCTYTALDQPKKTTHADANVDVNASTLRAIPFAGVKGR
jgi:hypothetical protein